MWDATCPDIFAATYRIPATSGAGKVDELAEERSKYKHLGPAYFITAIKTSGAIGPRSMAFLKELGRRLRCV